ncbi:MAG: hemolysin family protein [Acidobacteriota bacterium]|nr:hemolysin family protein [Acidobacteriota bacterium]MDQ5871688.1 hemolysin family protein [Acidobacteriota bacterium]
MIAFLASGFCYLAFLLFESFAIGLDRISSIKLRGLLEEHPERARILSGPGEMEIIRTTTKVLVQALLLAGLLTVVSGFHSFGVEPAWAWGGGVFLVGWLASEVMLLRFGASADSEKTVARLLPVVTGVSWLLAPLAIPVRKILDGRAAAAPETSPATEEEVQAYIDVGRQEGILEKEEEKLLMSIVDFGDTRVREVMTPRTDIVWIDVASSLTVLADLFVESKYSRIPVVRGSIDTVVGIIHVKDTLQSIRAGGSRPIAELVREAYFVPETKKVSELLREFQRRHLWMAIVVDEYGGVSGLATVEDLLEEIVGEISDEHEDEREEITQAGEQAYSVSGKANVGRIRDLFGRGPEEEEFSTLGGFLAARLGHIPRPGETHREGDLLFTVEEADRRRVHRVRVESDTVSVPNES